MPGPRGVITGAEGFAFLPREYGLPAAVAGFEPEDILLAVYDLLDMLSRGAPALVNDYPRAVSAGGNALAREMMARVLVPRSDIWRGLGEIDASGLGLSEEYAGCDAEARFGITVKPAGAGRAVPLRRRDNRPHPPRRLPDVREGLHAGRPARPLHGVQRGRLRGRIQVYGVDDSGRYHYS